METRIKQNEKDIREAMSLFTGHLEVYAENGKELAGLKVEVGGMKDAIIRLEKTLETKYVTQDQFRPVRALVYGVVAIILTAVIIAGLTFVIINKSNETNRDMVKDAVLSGINEYNLGLEDIPE